MNMTDPTESVASILTAFILVYLLIASCLYILIDLFTRKNIPIEDEAATTQAVVRRRRAYYLASIIAFAPVCLLAMQSLNQLKLLDLVLVVSLTALAGFYVLKRAA